MGKLRDHGATYNVYSDARGVARPWQLDALPLLVGRDEFEEVSAGLSQRTRLLNAILEDLYGPQRLLHDGWVPPSIVLGNPGYLREACGSGGRAPRLIMLGTDLARYERNVELTWRVPLGAHVVLQPDVQYVVNPGAERRIPNAWVVGVRLELSVSR